MKDEERRRRTWRMMGGDEMWQWGAMCDPVLPFVVEDIVGTGGEAGVDFVN